MSFSQIKEDLNRFIREAPSLSDARAFSPDAYNAIGALLLDHTYQALERINAEHGIEFHSNMAVMLFCDLHAKSCGHYFAEYERIKGLQEEPLVTRRSGLFQRLRPRSRLREWLSLFRANLKSGLGTRVQVSGTTTFRWQALRAALQERDIALELAPLGRPDIPLIGQQLDQLEQSALAAHADLAKAMGVPQGMLHSFVPALSEAANKLAAMPTLGMPGGSLMVTGTLGSLQTRLNALNAISHGVPVLTIHHGGQFKTYDEPYYDLYEGQIPDAKVVYGDIERQRELGTLDSERTLFGVQTLLYPRTDSAVHQLHTGESIPTIGSLRTKAVLYLPTEMESARYGPYRDVHPTIYQAWQEKLIAWLTEQTGQIPRVRLHPKRTTTRFDPSGGVAAPGNMQECLAEADVIVLDYPTTTMSLAAATSKPVMFFDIGLRRFQLAALEAVRARCSYAEVDMFDPAAGLASMEREIGRSPTDAFTPLFSIGKEDLDEVDAVAAAIKDAVSRLT